MSSSWAPVVAALGASALTGLFTLGVAAWIQARSSRTIALGDRREAYLGLLHAVSRLTAVGLTVRVTLQHRVGVAESAGVLMGLRRAVDLDEVQQRFERELVSILDAEARLWTVGSQPAIDASETVAIAATAYLEASGSMSVRQRRWIGIDGWRPSAEQEQALEKINAELMAARVEFVRVVRKEIGEVPVTLGDGHELPKAEGGS